MRCPMKKQLIILIFFLLTCSITARSKEAEHNGILTGVVKTADGEAAAFIAVFLKDTGFGKETDSDGKFSIPAPAGNYTTRF